MADSDWWLHTEHGLLSGDKDAITSVAVFTAKGWKASLRSRDPRWSASRSITTSWCWRSSCSASRSPGFLERTGCRVGKGSRRSIHSHRLTPSTITPPSTPRPPARSGHFLCNLTFLRETRQVFYQQRFMDRFRQIMAAAGHDASATRCTIYKEHIFRCSLHACNIHPDLSN